MGYHIHIFPKTDMIRYKNVCEYYVFKDWLSWGTVVGCWCRFEPCQSIWWVMTDQSESFTWPNLAVWLVGCRFDWWGSKAGNHRLQASYSLCVHPLLYSFLSYLSDSYNSIMSFGRMPCCRNGWQFVCLWLVQLCCWMFCCSARIFWTAFISVQCLIVFMLPVDSYDKYMHCLGQAPLLIPNLLQVGLPLTSSFLLDEYSSTR